MDKYTIKEEDVKSIQDKVNVDFEQLNEVVEGIIHPYVKDLDKYIKFIRECLKNGEEPPTNDELEDWCMNLSTFIYFAGGMCEQLGIKDDIAKAIYKEVYNNNRQDSKGTVVDKNSIAELASQQEYLISVCYTRSYKIVKSKIENAQELLSSCKKCLSHRMQEMELVRLSPH